MIVGVRDSAHRTVGMAPVGVRNRSPTIGPDVAEARPFELRSVTRGDDEVGVLAVGHLKTHKTEGCDRHRTRCLIGFPLRVPHDEAPAGDVEQVRL